MKVFLKLKFVMSALLFLSSFALPGSGPAAADTPRFQEYPAPTYNGRVQAPDLSSHPDARTYRTRLRNAVKGGINFSGDHVLATWGCGGQCLMGAVINARSGYVQFLPGTICCWLEAGEDINPVDFERGSDLLILTGLVNEEEPMARHYYDFSGREFRLIKTERLNSNAPGTGSGGGGGPQTVAPTCPPGYVLSGSQCAPYRPAAPAPPTNTAQFDIRHGYDLPGGDYDRVNGLNNYQECQSECANSDRCNGFTFNTRHFVCFLKWRGENWTPFGNAVSGLLRR